MVGLMADFIDTREEMRKNLMMREKIVMRRVSLFILLGMARNEKRKMSTVKPKHQVKPI